MSRPCGDARGRPRALVLSPEAPYPPVGGGALRTASVLEHLRSRYEVDLLLFREPGQPDPRAALPRAGFRRVLVLDLPPHAHHWAARLVRNLRRMLRGRPPLNDRFDGFAGTIARWVQGHHYELALIEHFWCARYAETLRAVARRLVLDMHNVESELYRRLAESERPPLRPVFRRFQRCLLRLEQRWLPAFDLVLAASPEDAARVRVLAPSVGVQVYPNAIPVSPMPTLPEQEMVAFSGNLEYQPNLGAVRFFRRKIWPVLRKKRPRLVWRVIGKNPHAVAGELRGDPRIELVGPVEDAILALAPARVVVVPLLAASGTRFKILEAWAAGRAVVSTTLGAEGLGARDGEHLVLADDPETFAQAVLDLLDSAERRTALGRAGRDLYLRCFSWPAAWRYLTEAGF